MRPLLRRGRCRDCGTPSIEKLSTPGMPALTLVPAENLDVDDGLPKYSGFLKSQIGLSVALVKAMLGGRR